MTAYFRTNDGTRWDPALNVGTLKRVREETGRDILELLEKNSSLLSDMRKDPLLLTDILYSLCRAQARARHVTRERFDELFTMETLRDGFYAFLEAFARFFWEPARGEMLNVLRTMRGTHAQPKTSGVSSSKARASAE